MTKSNTTDTGIWPISGSGPICQVANPPYTSSPRLRTASPEISCAKPRAAIITASVTTMGWMRAFATIVPESAPIAVVSRTGSTKNNSGDAWRSASCPAKHEPTASSAPTDRSTPPVKMTSVCPTAISAVVKAKPCNCKRMFDSVKKFGLRIEATMTRMTSPSGAPKRRKFADTALRVILRKSPS